MTDRPEPAAAFEAFDRLVDEAAVDCQCNDDLWTDFLSNDAADCLQALDAACWARLRQTLLGPDRSMDWKDFCCRALGQGVAPEAWQLLFDGLEHGDEALVAFCADNLCDLPLDGSAQIPPEAIEAVRRMADGASRAGNRYAAAAFLNRIGAR
jgi:hypothetical protein